MKLYYAPGACSLAVMVIIHELNLHCEYEYVDLTTKKTETDINFISINPKGSVPALILQNNVVLTENIIIQKYLVETYHATQLLPDVCDFNHYRVLEWLSFISSDIHKGCCAPLYNSGLTSQIKNNIYQPFLHKKLTRLDQALQENYLVGKDFTLADANLFVILTWLPDLNVDISRYKNLQRHYNLLINRPSIATALKIERQHLVGSSQ
jgi:glutathione S-transferase